jgi:hypothetical protein
VRRDLPPHHEDEEDWLYLHKHEVILVFVAVFLSSTSKNKEDIEKLVH